VGVPSVFFFIFVVVVVVGGGAAGAAGGGGGADAEYRRIVGRFRGFCVVEFISDE